MNERGSYGALAQRVDKLEGQQSAMTFGLFGVTVLAIATAWRFVRSGRNASR